MGAQSKHDQGASADALALCHCDAHSRQDKPGFQITLWPHRSLGPQGQRNVVWLAAAGLAIPVFGLLLQGAALIVGAFAVLTIAAFAFAMRRNMFDGQLREDVAIWPNLMAVTRQEPDGKLRHWCCHPANVRLHIDPDGPPENYLTLSGGPRRIELGAFLTPEERLELHNTLADALKFSGLPR